MKTIVASQRAVSPTMSHLVAANTVGATGSSLLFWPLAILLFVLASACPAADAFSESQRIVSQYKAVFASPSKRLPAFHAVDSPITGNGDIGLTLNGPPERQRYWISKCDFWKSGPSFKQCGPSLIGGIDVSIESLKDASYHVEQTLYEPVLASKFATPKGSVTINAWVSATDSLVVLELAAHDAPVRVQIDLWTKDGYGSETAKGSATEVTWATRKFVSSDLLFPTEAIIALRTSPSVPAAFTLEPGKPITVVAAVMTNHDAKGYETLAVQKARDATTGEVVRLRAEHRKWWQSFWAESYVELEDKLLEKHYYASHYVMACCSRNPKFPPGLYGNWITLDRTAWSGDIHLNYNHQTPFWALYSSNHIGLTECYDAPLLEQLEGFQRDARTFLNKKGAYASVGIGPKGLICRFPDKAGLDQAYKAKCNPGSYDDLAGQPMFLGQKSNALFAAMNMILRYEYTYDINYLRKVYPYLTAVADFWEDYLVLENGRYVIHDDSYGEVGPWEGKDWKKLYGDFNPILSLGFLRVFFPSIINYSKVLERDADKRAKWQDVLDRLSELPVVVENGRKRFRACEGGSGSGSKIVGLDWMMIHSLVFPATNFGLSSDASSLAMIREDIKSWNDWSRHDDNFQGLLIGAARVGYDPDFLVARAKAVIAKRSLPNLWIRSGGGGIETCSGIPGMINEMMLQSHGGVMRIFPVFPRGQSGSFHRLRTFGAFLVSGAIDKGVVQPIVIESEKGRPCVLQNPWPGKKVIISSKQGQTREISGDVLRLPTVEGERLTLTPQG
jgi:alpha-L-fucosidase 2